jgi:hypothetical protein
MTKRIVLFVLLLTAIIVIAVLLAYATGRVWPPELPP